MKSRYLLNVILLAAGLILLLFVRGNFPAPTRGGQRSSCRNNLRQMEGAAQQWASDNHKTAINVVTLAELSPYLKDAMRCPQGGHYSVGPSVTNAPRCSLKEHHL